MKARAGSRIRGRSAALIRSRPSPDLSRLLSLGVGLAMLPALIVLAGACSTGPTPQPTATVTVTAPPATASSSATPSAAPSASGTASTTVSVYFVRPIGGVTDS